MVDAEFAEQKARLQALAERWIAQLGLKWWTITIHYERVPTETAKTEENKIQNYKTLFRVYSDWRYGCGSIYANMLLVAESSDEELELWLVHELCHIFINETSRANDGDWLDHEERVATTLAKAFIWLRDAVRDECKAEEAKKD